MAKKVIIDCDVGVDDALALILAFHSPELHVGAVTAVNGNVPLPMVYTNIRRVLSLLKPAHKPLIARGAEKPLSGKGVYAYDVHGGNGLGGAKIRETDREEWWQASPKPAHELICGILGREPGEWTLIAVGPLTNLALALEHDPQGLRAAKEIVIMGGAVRTEGNVTPLAEFNIYVDPLAAQKVLASGIPISLIPLDITHHVWLNAQTMQKRIGSLENPFPRFLIEATGYDPVCQKFYGGRSVFYLHDPLAVGAAVAPDLIGFENLAIKVETERGGNFGQTREVDDQSGKKIRVGTSVDSEGFLNLFIERLTG